MPRESLIVSGLAVDEPIVEAGASSGRPMTKLAPLAAPARAPILPARMLLHRILPITVTLALASMALVHAASARPHDSSRGTFDREVELIKQDLASLPEGSVAAVEYTSGEPSSWQSRSVVLSLRVIPARIKAILDERPMVPVRSDEGVHKGCYKVTVSELRSGDVDYFVDGLVGYAVPAGKFPVIEDKNSGSRLTFSPPEGFLRSQSSSKHIRAEAAKRGGVTSINVLGVDLREAANAAHVEGALPLSGKSHDVGQPPDLRLDAGAVIWGDSVEPKDATVVLLGLVEVLADANGAVSSGTGYVIEVASEELTLNPTSDHPGVVYSRGTELVIRSGQIMGCASQDKCKRRELEKRDPGPGGPTR